MTRPITWTQARRDALARHLEDGLSFAKAANRLGVARGSVCWATARFGIGREPADLSTARAAVSDWDESKLTERWADRGRK